MTKKCKSPEESLQVAANLRMYLVLQNSNFKDNDFSDEPIKKYLKNYQITSKFN